MHLFDYFEKDIWLSNIFKQDCFNLRIEASSNWRICHAEIKNEFQNIIGNPCFITAKIDTDQIESIKFLEENGFFLVDTNVILKCNRIVSDKIFMADKINVHFSQPNDREEVSSLSGQSFSNSRFHLDPMISSNLANRIKYEWSQNYYNGDRGDFMVVASLKKRIIGFLLLIKNESELFIDLIAVHPLFRNKSIGNRLIQFANDNIVGFDSILVGTQISNALSISFYEKLGFRFSQSKYVFHFHR